MSRAELEARVNVLASDTLQMVDLLSHKFGEDWTREFIVYVGHDELNAIRYIAGQFYGGNWDNETFCSHRLIGVKVDSYFHVAVK